MNGFKKINPAIILSIILFQVLFALTIYKMIDTDIWFHMKAGQVILETGRFLYEDIFSYTAEGQEWIYHEWLFGVVFYKIYSIFGVNGLIISKSILLSLTFFFAYRGMMLRSGNPFLSSFILITAVLSARFRFTERPHLFEMLFTVIFIYAMELHRAGSKRAPWILPFIQLLWTNMHGSFILGPMIVIAYMASGLIIRWKKGLLAVLILVSLATLINPYGFRLLLFTFGFGGRELTTYITEWSPMPFSALWSPFGFLIITGGISTLFILVSYVKGRKTDDAGRLMDEIFEPSDILMLLFFIALSFKAVRFKALSVFALSPLIAGNIGFFISRMSFDTAKRISVSIVSITAITFLFVQEMKRNRILVFGLGRGQAFSEGAIDFLKGRDFSGNMYNSYVLGGYLIWGLYPEKKVFVDGRAELFSQTYENNPTRDSWARMIDKYKINYAVLTYHPEGIDPIGDSIPKDPAWVLAYWDDSTKVYLRNVAANNEMIDKYGHREFSDPAKLDYRLVKSAIEKDGGMGLENELKRDIGLNGRNIKARYWLGMLCYEVNRREDAISEWEALVAIIPDALTFSAIGNIYFEVGNHQKAIEYNKMAIKTDRRLADAYYNLGIAYETIGDRRGAEVAYRGFIEYAGPERAALVSEVRKRFGLE